MDGAAQSSGSRCQRLHGDEAAPPIPVQMGFKPKEMKQLREELQKAAERASMFIWLKRDDAGWMEDGALAES